MKKLTTRKFNNTLNLKARMEVITIVSDIPCEIHFY